MYKSGRISTNEIVFTIKRIKGRASEFPWGSAMKKCEIS